MIRLPGITLLIAGLSLAAVGLACGAGAAPLAGSGGAGATQPVSATLGLPTPTITSQYFLIQPTAAAVEPSAVPPAIPESRRLTLEFPSQIRVGDSDVIRLTLEVDALGNLTPTAEVQGNMVTGATVQIPNLYNTHNVTAEARLDMAGVAVRPSETISEALLPGQSATFYWSVRPADPGTFRGTAWLHLRFVDKVSGQESRIAVSAQPVQIEAGSFFGLSGSAARSMGGVGSVIGAILGFPFIGDLLKWLWRHMKPVKSNI